MSNGTTGRRSSPDKVVAHISSHLLASIQALNDRDFDRAISPLYRGVAPFWRANIEWVPASLRTFTIEEWVGWYRKVIAKHPNFRILPGAIEAAGDGARWQLFLTLDVEGIHPDLISQTVLMSEYRLVEGKWMSVWVENMPGVGMDGGR